MGNCHSVKWIFWSLFIVSFGFLSCKKSDNPRLSQGQIENVDTSSSCIYEWILRSGSTFKELAVNPENPNEFLIIDEEGIALLNTSNTGLDRLKHGYIDNVIWEVNSNTIVFSDGEISQIDKSGDFLAQLSPDATQKVYYAYPSFDLTGDRLFFASVGQYSEVEYDSHPDLWLHTTMLVKSMDSVGTSDLDTFCLPYKMGCRIWNKQIWLNDNEFLTVLDLDESGILNLAKVNLDGNFELLHTIGPNQYFLDLVYLKDQAEVYYTMQKQGMFRFGLNDRQKTILKAWPEDGNYTSIDIVPDQEIILAINETWNEVAPCTTIVSSKIVSIDIQTLKEKEVYPNK